MSLVNSEYGLSTSQIRVVVLARRFELGDARPNCWQLISFSPHDHDMITTAIYHCSQNLTGASYIYSRILSKILLNLLVLHFKYETQGKTTKLISDESFFAGQAFWNHVLLNVKNVINLPIVNSCPASGTRSTLKTHTCKSSTVW